MRSIALVITALAMAVPAAAEPLQLHSGDQVHFYSNGHQTVAPGRFAHPQTPTGGLPVVSYLGRPHYLLPNGRLVHADHISARQAPVAPAGSFYFSSDPYDHRH